MFDYLATLLRGLLLGLAIAAPVGPIGVLCIRRTLAHGRRHGFVSGMGAATADGFYGMIAAFGLTIISDQLVRNADILGLVGGLFLLYLGIATLRAVPSEAAAETHMADRSLMQNYLSTLFLTISNPITILSFGAIFAGAGIATSTGDRSLALTLVIGVFSGSLLWWFILTGGVSMLRSHFTARHMLWINRGSGLIILVFALVALASLLR